MSNQYHVKITPKTGFTGKDHLLPELADYVQGLLKPGYSTKQAAAKAAERKWYKECNRHPLFVGCAAGFGCEVTKV